MRIYEPIVLTEKTLRIVVRKLRYFKADTPTSMGNSGGGGADPHSHGVSYTVTETMLDDVGIEGQPDIAVHYKVA